MLVNRADSHTSGARFVGRRCLKGNSFLRGIGNEYKILILDDFSIVVNNLEIVFIFVVVIFSHIVNWQVYYKITPNCM